MSADNPPINPTANKRPIIERQVSTFDDCPLVSFRFEKKSISIATIDPELNHQRNSTEYFQVKTYIKLKFFTGYFSYDSVTFLSFLFLSMIVLFANFELFSSLYFHTASTSLFPPLSHFFFLSLVFK